MPPKKTTSFHPQVLMKAIPALPSEAQEGFQLLPPPLTGMRKRVNVGLKKITRQMGRELMERTASIPLILKKSARTGLEYLSPERLKLDTAHLPPQYEMMSPFVIREYLGPDRSVFVDYHVLKNEKPETISRLPRRMPATGTLSTMIVFSRYDENKPTLIRTFPEYKTWVLPSNADFVRIQDGILEYHNNIFYHLSRVDPLPPRPPRIPSARPRSPRNSGMKARFLTPQQEKMIKDRVECGLCSSQKEKKDKKKDILKK